MQAKNLAASGRAPVSRRAPAAVAPRSRVAMGVSTSPSKPVWTGDTLPSRLANWAISTPWVFSLLKLLAKDQMKKTAASKGVKWDDHVSGMQARLAELEAIKQELENPSVVYPYYYLQPFHAYDEGNLNWLAAFEVEVATYCVALRTYGKIDPSLDGPAAYRRLATSATSTLRDYYAKHGLAAPKNILDVGCSIGMSTRWVAQQFPDCDITGLDLSPYFLAVAEWMERQRVPAGAKRIKYVHGTAENSGVPDSSVDCLLFQYIIHECPQRTIQNFCREGFRMVKPGGAVMFVDNNPRSKTIQGLSPAIATLMKSTEPWSDEYFSFDVEAAMREEGFSEVVTVEIDHRHRAVLGLKR